MHLVHNTFAVIATALYCEHWKYIHWWIFVSMNISHLLAAIQCPEPEERELTEMTIEGVFYSQLVHYDCIDGYAINTDTNITEQERQTITCQADGTWDINPLPCPHSKFYLCYEQS